MKYGTGFLWGKINGIFAGSIAGLIGGPLFILAYPNELMGQFDTIGSALFVASFTGSFAGGMIGAFMGTAVGVLLVWSQQYRFGSQIGLFFGGVVGLILLTLIAPDSEQGAVLLPLLGLVWGGCIGWISGRFLEKKAYV